VLPSFSHHSSLREPKDTLQLPENLTLNADLNVNGADLVIAGQVQGKINLQDGSLRVLGKIIEGVSVRNGDIFLDKNASIGGDVLCVDGKIQRNEGAQVSGSVQEIKEQAKPEVQPQKKEKKKGGFFYQILVNQYAASIILLPLLFLTSILFSKRILVIKNAIEERSVRCFVVGVTGFSLWLLMFWVFPALYFVMPAFKGNIFQYGYPPIMVLILLPFLLAGVSACLYLVGQKLLMIFEISTDKRIIISVVGLLFTFIVGVIPAVGWVLWICVLFVGIGAACLSRLGTRLLMPKVRLRPGERRKSIPTKLWRKGVTVGLSLALILPPLCSLGYFGLYVFFPGPFGLAKPEYSVKEAYSIKQLDFVEDHFRLEMKNAVFVPFYLAGHKVGAYVKGEGRYFFSLVKDAPAQAEGNIAETKLSEVYVLADSRGYFSQFEKEGNLVSEDVEGILRDAKESLDRIAPQIGRNRRFYGVIRKKIIGPKLVVFLLRLNGQDRGEALANRTFANEASYHPISFKAPIIEILYWE